MINPSKRTTEQDAMNAQESISIENLLKRNSYECSYANDVVTVRDPVQSSTQGTIYNDVKIRSFQAAIRFVEERS
jgi:hypothetical protein